MQYFASHRPPTKNPSGMSLTSTCTSCDYIHMSAHIVLAYIYIYIKYKYSVYICMWACNKHAFWFAFCEWLRIYICYLFMDKIWPWECHTCMMTLHVWWPWGCHTCMMRPHVKTHTYGAICCKSDLRRSHRKGRVAYIHTYIHTYIHSCMHTYIHSCMHTYIHTYVAYAYTCTILIRCFAHTQTIHESNLPSQFVRASGFLLSLWGYLFKFLPSSYVQVIFYLIFSLLA